MISAVIFDMDGLLINSEPLWMQAEQEIFETIGINLTDEMCKLTRGVRIKNVVEFWFAKNPWHVKTIDEISVEITNLVIELIKKNGKALEGVYEVLEYFKRKNLKIAVATSSSTEIIIAVMDKLQLNNYFHAIHSADQEQYGKPHPAVYISCAHKIKTDVTNCLAFEDSFIGLLAAKAARMKVVAVPEKENADDEKLIIADAILFSLKEFNDELFDKLNRWP
jgi:mannitol-1-/sugar-/sorbitol-6-/2-deoxyglucose-6-phosphatase